jgi:hypothetical protein
VFKMKQKREEGKFENLGSGMIVLGGRDQDGESLQSVEKLVFLAGRWNELPPMNTPRSFAASVFDGDKIIVSGGDTGHTITDTIETLNLRETPLQWITSDATLPVPLSGHQTVVHRGKLITIGGHDGNEGRNSDIIYEVSLTPPYTTRKLASLPRPSAWHGAELVNDKIFIFGGARSLVDLCDQVVVFDLLTNRYSEMSRLPYRVQGMATARMEKKVFLLGGVNEREGELDNVITYDVESGETANLPSMTARRGCCCAVISSIIENGGSCSPNTPTVTLIALGSLQQLNTVERFDFHSRNWSDLPPTRDVRRSSTAVACPIDFL